MGICHVAITGRDRRHLSELGAKLRIVVVGHREEKRGIVVDAYVPSQKIDWLRRKGYGVEPIEEEPAARAVRGNAQGHARGDGGIARVLPAGEIDARVHRRSRRQAAEHFRTVSHVRVVTPAPNVFSISAMKTGPRGFGI